MAVVKRQGRSEDQSDDFRQNKQNKQNKQHSWLSPICIGQAQVEEKKNIQKEEPKRFLKDSLSRVHARALSLSFSLSLSPSPCTPPLSSLRVLDSPPIL